MESTSLANMIQASEASAVLLEENFPEFLVEERGLCQVKVIDFQETKKLLVF